MLALLLAAAMIGPPAPPASLDVAARQCPEARTAELFHGFVVDSAREGGGLLGDLWSTEFALARCPGCREGNPLGVSRAARIYLKGAGAVATVALCHKLRRDGHPEWATWTGRAALALQLVAAGSNVWRGTHPR